MLHQLTLFGLYLQLLWMKIAMHHMLSVQLQNLRSAKQSVQENLQLLQQNDELTQEQVETMIRLFQSGSVNILQLVDLLNRHAEILDQEKVAQLEFLKISSQAIQKTEFHLPEDVKPSSKDML